MSDSAPITILLVDDHFVVRSGLVASLDSEDHLDVVSEAENGESAIEAYGKLLPSVVLMDLQLPGMNGTETTERLLESYPEARVLMFSTFARDDEIQAALDTGVLGYLQKSADRSDLIRAIEAVAAGESYLPAGLAERLAALQLGANITLREREILTRVAKGMANKEIAADLGIAEDTVKRHISNVFQKLQVNDRAQATAEAIRRGIVRVED